MIKRNIKSAVQAALRRSPVVLLTGARQVGKSVLAQNLAQENDYSYYTLDDIPTYLAAKEDPMGFIKTIAKPAVIDEVQRVPNLFLAIKHDVDQERKPGKFLLTGSANPLAIPQVADALTGRIETISLYPLSQGEIEGIRETFVDRLFKGDMPKAPTVKNKLSLNDLYERILQGGYPVLQGLNDEERRIWFNEYIKNIVQKDAQDIAKISDPGDLYAYLYSLAHRAAGLLNVADISRNLGFSNVTLLRYTALLEALYVVYLAYPWHLNPAKKYVKTRKSFLVDSGFLATLLKLKSPEALAESPYVGGVVENFVVMELLKQLSWSKVRAELSHFRTTSGVEVDIVLEDDGGEFVGIEVKNSATVRPDDFKGLKVLQELTGDKFIKGIVLYTGEHVLPFGKDLLAVPMASLWTI